MESRGGFSFVKKYCIIYLTMKPKPITLYAVVDKLKPKLTYFSIIQSCDKNFQRLKKGEKIITVTIQAK